MNRIAFFGIVAVISTAIVGCGSVGTTPPPTPPILSVSATSESFTAVQGGANPAAASVTVSNTGGGTLAFSATSDSPWLTVTPTSGTAPQTLQINAALGALPVGMVTGHITITAPGVAGSPATVTANFFVTPIPSNTPFWAQWGANPQHAGMVAIAGQSAIHKLADIVYEPFVNQEKAENAAVFGAAELTAHYQAPIVDGNDVYVMMKTGTYKSCTPAGVWFLQGAACGPNTWNTMIWDEARFSWINNQLTQIWNFASDWKPEPNGNGLEGWEPVFHPVDASGFIYVPGAGGTIWKVNKTTGAAASHINPFSGTNIVVGNTFVAGPLTADSQSNIYYTVIELADPSAGDPWTVKDAVSAWLVKVKPDNTSSVATFASLVPNAPAATAITCPAQFTRGPNGLCGMQRPGINIAPAIAPDGTVYIGSVAHFNSAQAYLVAVNPNLTPKWAASMQSLLPDACGGTPPCILGSGLVNDQSSSSPTVAPDGSVLYGAFTAYNGERGHLMKFDSFGNFQGSFDFGWDSTPAIYVHGGAYSIVIKDNHYATNGPYYITQLNPNLQIEWQFQNTNPGLPNGFEWCINMPAVDMNGSVYANSEDGSIYVIPQGHTGIFTTPQSSLFLNLALGAAYTPLSIGPDGRLYTQNNGHLFAVGN